MFLLVNFCPVPQNQSHILSLDDSEMVHKFPMQMHAHIFFVCSSFSFARFDGRCVNLFFPYLETFNLIYVPIQSYKSICTAIHRNDVVRWNVLRLLVVRSVAWLDEFSAFVRSQIPCVHDVDRWYHCIRCLQPYPFAWRALYDGDHVWKIISTKPLVSGVISSACHYILHERWVALYLYKCLVGIVTLDYNAHHIHVYSTRYAHIRQCLPFSPVLLVVVSCRIISYAAYILFFCFSSSRVIVTWYASRSYIRCFS